MLGIDSMYCHRARKIIYYARIKCKDKVDTTEQQQQQQNTHTQRIETRNIDLIHMYT